MDELYQRFVDSLAYLSDRSQVKIVLYKDSPSLKSLDYLLWAGDWHIATEFGGARPRKAPCNPCGQLGK